MKKLRSMNRWTVFLVTAIIFLPACSLLPGAGKVEPVIKAAISTGISDRRSYNDDEARLLLILPCDISIGAYYRLTNSVQQEALGMLCSGRRSGEDIPSLIPSGS